MGLSCDAPVPLAAAGLKLKAFVVGTVAYELFPARPTGTDRSQIYSQGTLRPAPRRLSTSGE